jgi:hypothetical protein
MQLRPEALRFVLAQGLPATIEVVGASMTPTIAVGDKVSVVAWPRGGERAGEIVLVETAGEQLLLHRVMHVFAERGATFVAHQGDAGGELAIVAREAVLGRLSAFADGRPAPTPERLDAVARSLYARRRVAAVALVAARRAARLLGVGESPAARTWGRRLRALARRLAG